MGLVAAAKVKNGPVRALGPDTLYKDVEFITPIPKRGEALRGMPFSMVAEVTGKSFFWARTIKVPYLTKHEAEKLAGELKRHLEARP